MLVPVPCSHPVMCSVLLLNLWDHDVMRRATVLVPVPCSHPVMRSVLLLSSWDYDIM